MLAVDRFIDPRIVKNRNFQKPVTVVTFCWVAVWTFSQGTLSVQAVRDGALGRAAAWQRATISRSTATYVSEFRLWLALHVSGILSGLVFHASPADALTFIGFFRNGDSAVKCLSAVKWFYNYAHHAVTWESGALKQALSGGHKLEQLKVKIKGSVRWLLLSKMVGHVWARGEFFLALAFVEASMFLLRCRNELIPLRWEAISFETPQGEKPVVKFRFASRKNMPAGTELSRRCLCPKWEQICPVHIFSRALAKSNQVIPCSGKVFHFSYDYFLRELRRVLRELGIEGADTYSTKAFRRGTAQEILENGGGLGEVCKAAQWSSKAFKFYLDQKSIDELAIFQALEDLSDAEDDATHAAPATAAVAPVLPAVVSGESGASGGVGSEPQAPRKRATKGASAPSLAAEEQLAKQARFMESWLER